MCDAASVPIKDHFVDALEEVYLWFVINFRVNRRFQIIIFSFFVKAGQRSFDQ